MKTSLAVAATSRSQQPVNARTGSNRARSTQTARALSKQLWLMASRRGRRSGCAPIPSAQVIFRPNRKRVPSSAKLFAQVRQRNEADHRLFALRNRVLSEIVKEVSVPLNHDALQLVAYFVVKGIPYRTDHSAGEAAKVGCRQGCPFRV